MARRKKVTQEQIAQAMLLWGGLSAPKPDEGIGIMDVFAQGLSAGMTIGREQEKADRRKRENNG